MALMVVVARLQIDTRQFSLVVILQSPHMDLPGWTCHQRRTRGRGHWYSRPGLLIDRLRNDIHQGLQPPSRRHRTASRGRASGSRGIMQGSGFAWQGLPHGRHREITKWHVMTRLIEPHDGHRYQSLSIRWRPQHTSPIQLVADQTIIEGGAMDEPRCNPRHVGVGCYYRKKAGLFSAAQ